MRKTMKSNEKATNIARMPILSFAAIAIALAILSGIVSAETTTFPQIKVTLINQEPDPVAPGNTVDVRFRIENEGGGAAQNVEIKVVPGYPFSSYGSEEDFRAMARKHFQPTP